MLRNIWLLLSITNVVDCISKQSASHYMVLKPFLEELYNLSCNFAPSLERAWVLKIIVIAWDIITRCQNKGFLLTEISLLSDLCFKVNRSDILLIGSYFWRKKEANVWPENEAIGLLSRLYGGSGTWQFFGIIQTGIT